MVEKRPYVDHTDIIPISRGLCSAMVLGRPGDPREDDFPMKFTVKQIDHIRQEAQTEWESRLNENICAMKLLNENKITNIDTFTSYLAYPPIWAAKVRQNKPTTVLVFGKSVDIDFTMADIFSLEALPFIASWHYENGMQTYRMHFDQETGAGEILQRRHLKVGEMFKDLLCQRPVAEGSMLARDIIMDLRNEQTPEYAQAALHHFAYMDMFSPDVQAICRSLMEMLMKVYCEFQTDKLGWPYMGYGNMVPRPPALDMLLQNPADIWCIRFNGLLAGSDWSSRYVLTHQETVTELFGQEIIPPKSGETAHAYLRYGMDRYEYPNSYNQSTRAYGAEASATPPTDFPLPAKTVVSFAESDKIIDAARKEHPEWLTGTGSTY